MPGYHPATPYKPLQRNRLDRGPIDRYFPALFPYPSEAVELCLLTRKRTIEGSLKIVFLSC